MDQNQNLSGSPTATRLLGEKIIQVAERGVLEPDLLLSMALNELDSDWPANDSEQRFTTLLRPGVLR